MHHQIGLFNLESAHVITAYAILVKIRQFNWAFLVLQVLNLGFVILTQSLKFIRGEGYSHHFEHTDSNGGKIFGIKRYLGVNSAKRCEEKHCH